jgi:hypothetical protein
MVAGSFKRGKAWFLTKLLAAFQDAGMEGLGSRGCAPLLLYRRASFWPSRWDSGTR